jgi:hypothetical protein
MISNKNRKNVPDLILFFMLIAMAVYVVCYKQAQSTQDNIIRSASLSLNVFNN